MNLLQHRPSALTSKKCVKHGWQLSIKEDGEEGKPVAEKSDEHVSVAISLSFRRFESIKHASM